MTAWKLVDSYPREIGGNLAYLALRGREVDGKVETMRGLDALADLFESLVLDAAGRLAAEGEPAVMRAIEAALETSTGDVGPVPLRKYIETIHFVRVRGTEVDLAFTAAQLGAVGLLALVAMFAVMWWQAGRLEPPARVAARALVLTIALGCLLNSFLIDHTEGMLFAWMAGVLLAAPRRLE